VEQARGANHAASSFAHNDSLVSKIQKSRL